jgi:hypothetical protein
VSDRKRPIHDLEPLHVEDPSTRRAVVQSEIDEIEIRLDDLMVVCRAVSVVRLEGYTQGGGVARRRNVIGERAQRRVRVLGIRRGAGEAAERSEQSRQENGA